MAKLAGGRAAEIRARGMSGTTRGVYEVVAVDVRGEGEGVGGEDVHVAGVWGGVCEVEDGKGDG